MLSKKRKERDEREEVETKKVKTNQEEGVSVFPPTGNKECITATNSEGKRVYIILDPEEEEEKENFETKNKKPFKMLKEPITEIIQNYENKIKESLQMSEKKKSEQKNEKQETELWVEKYSPKTFTDLITNEKTNRQILKLITSWKESKKIILLSGPPGLGKTTLSHILLKKAGYNPIEINASDDRTNSKLETKINTMMEVKNVFGNKKPNALIIDEIDGISGGESSNAIKSLLKMNLKNPVICICNNLYASSLRKLRMSSENFIFYKSDINNEKILERLKFILKMEKINENLFNSSILENLISQSEGDIRSCLNTLQFSIKNFDGKAKQFVIQKDAKKNYFDIMKLIFQGTEKGNDSDQHFLKNIEFEEKYLEGCFENYPMMKFKDYDFEKTNSVLNYLEFSDFLNLRIKQTQNFQLFEYLKLCLKNFHLNCKTIEVKKFLKFEYPKNDFEFKTSLKKNQTVLKLFHNSLNSNLKLNYLTNDLFFDFIPFSIQLLNPSTIKFTDFLNEKKRIKQLAQIHQNYGLEYKIISKNEFKFEPEIDLFFEKEEGFKINHTLRKNIQNEINLLKIKKPKQNEESKKEKKIKLSTPTKQIDHLPITFRFNEEHQK
eukprot:gene992-9898_t